MIPHRCPDIAAPDIAARVRIALLPPSRGATWNEIGRALGVSKQAAHARYRNLQPAARERH